MEFIMNNAYIATLLCTIVLAFAPACTKKSSRKASPKDEISTMIELDNTVFEIEEIDADNDQKSIAKF